MRTSLLICLALCLALALVQLGCSGSPPPSNTETQRENIEKMSGQSMPDGPGVVGGGGGNMTDMYKKGGGGKGFDAKSTMPNYPGGGAYKGAGGVPDSGPPPK